MSKITKEIVMIFLPAVFFAAMLFIIVYLGYKNGAITSKYDRFYQEYDSCVKIVKKKADYSWRDLDNCELLACIHNDIKGNCFSE